MRRLKQRQNDVVQAVAHMCLHLRCKPTLSPQLSLMSAQIWISQRFPHLFRQIPIFNLALCRQACESVPLDVLGVLQGVEVALKSQKDITVGEALAPAVAGILLGYPVTYILREKGLTHYICSLCRIIGNDFRLLGWHPPADGRMVGNCLGCQPLLRYELTARISSTVAARCTLPLCCWNPDLAMIPPSLSSKEINQEERHVVFAFTVPAGLAADSERHIEKCHHGYGISQKSSRIVYTNHHPPPLSVWRFVLQVVTCGKTFSCAGKRSSPRRFRYSRASAGSAGVRGALSMIH
jgi:hypothetical protein